jgi:hypothetical protein
MTDTLESDMPIPMLLFGSMDSLYGIKQSIKPYAVNKPNKG